jgi:hypothetical protein
VQLTTIRNQEISFTLSHWQPPANGKTSRCPSFGQSIEATIAELKSNWTGQDGQKSSCQMGEQVCYGWSKKGVVQILSFQFDQTFLISGSSQPPIVIELSCDA